MVMMPKLDRTAQTDQHGSAAARRTSNVLLGVLYSNCEISSIFEGQDHVALSQQWRPSDLPWRPNMTAVATKYDRRGDEFRRRGEEIRRHGGRVVCRGETAAWSWRNT
jgi:hypothetical protein